jgi:hypothetical protein
MEVDMSTTSTNPEVNYDFDDSLRGGLVAEDVSCCDGE